MRAMYKGVVALIVAAAAVVVCVVWIQRERRSEAFRDAVWGAEQCETVKDWDGALARYDEALALDSAEPCIQYYRGRLLLRLQRVEDAADAFRTARGVWIAGDHEEDSYGVNLSDIELAEAEYSGRRVTRDR